MSKLYAIANPEELCWCCFKKHNNLNTIYINALGYGSSFDGFSTKIKLCDSCYEKSISTNKFLWRLNVVVDSFENYEYESEIVAFISSLPLQSQELIYNRFGSGYSSSPMGSQDWIDFELSLLPHDVCKKYGVHSNEEIQAYTYNFPTCEYPINRVFSDGSVVSFCPFGASCGYDECGNLELENHISTECYMCKYYKLRCTPLKEVLDKDWPDYEIYVKYNSNKEYLIAKFETCI